MIIRHAGDPDAIAHASVLSHGNRRSALTVGASQSPFSPPPILSRTPTPATNRCGMARPGIEAYNPT